MQEEYEVESIIGKRKNRQQGITLIDEGRFEYRVKWKGYSIRQSTWEPVEHLHPNLVEQYQTSQQPLNTHLFALNAKPKPVIKKEIEDINIRQSQKSHSSSQVHDIIGMSGVKKSDQIPKLLKDTQNAPPKIGFVQPIVDVPPPLAAHQKEKKPGEPNSIMRTQKDEDSFGESSCTFSEDEEDPPEVLSMAESAGKWVFQVSFPGEGVHYVTHQAMRREFPSQLVTFYQKCLIEGSE